MQDLISLFNANRGRDFHNDFHAIMWARTREAIHHMRKHPDMAYRCGVYALNNVARDLTGRGYGSTGHLPSGEQGFSLGQLPEIADRHELPLRAAFREVGQALVLPSGVHWSQNHYAAILREQSGRVKVVDPTSGVSSRSRLPMLVNRGILVPFLDGKLILYDEKGRVVEQSAIPDASITECVRVSGSRAAAIVVHRENGGERFVMHLYLMTISRNGKRSTRGELPAEVTRMEARLSKS